MISFAGGKVSQRALQWCIACLLVTSPTLTTYAADRGLIMTISAYPKSPLPGATLDDANARKILGRIGFDTDNVRSLRDGELNAASIESALSKLVTETQNGDRVFVHFSGHGTSQSVGGKCQQSLVGHDMKMVAGSTVATSLQQLKDKASKVLVVIDACHSGGVVEVAGTRGGLNSRPKSTRFRPRYVETGVTCDKPTNVIEETVSVGMRSLRGATVSKNFLYLAAAKHDEVAFDAEGKGGMATTSLLDCLQSSIPDSDKSGGVSFRELVSCAQTLIDKEFSGDPVLRPHHLTVAGNADLPLAVESAPLPGNTKANPVATLRDLQNGADSRWKVDIAANPPRAKIGKDAFTLTVTSSQKGYLYLIYVGSDQKEFMQLYPEGNESNVVEAKRPFRIPGEFAAGGPAGTNHVLALVSKEPRDFSRILGTGSASATLANATAIQDVSCATRNLKRRECQSGNLEGPAGTRNLKRVTAAEGESDTYGASIVELVEW